MHAEQSGSGEFARLLAGIQERAGLSLPRIAEIAGVDRSQAWRWINSGATPGYEPVRRLAEYLIAERPEVAEAASRLLAAAGYAPSDASGPDIAAPRRRPIPLLQDIPPEVAAYRAVIDAERDNGFPPKTDQEANIWASDVLDPDGGEEERRSLVALLRYHADESARSSSRESGLMQA